MKIFLSKNKNKEGKDLLVIFIFALQSLLISLLDKEIESLFKYDILFSLRIKIGGLNSIILSFLVLI